MRVVVTGASGNVGTAVLRALRGEVDDLVGIARRLPSPGSAVHDGVRWHAANMAEDDLTPVFEGADAVVHLAWQFHPTRRPEVTWQANVVGSQRVFDAAVRAGVGAVVHTSSVGAYSPGPAGGHGAQAPRVDESWPTDALPVAGYGREKAYVERVLDTVEARHPDLRVVRLRPAFVFQPAAAPEQRRIFAGPFVPTRLLANGHLPVLPIPRDLHLQAVHADDLAEAFRAAVQRPVRGAFNVAAEPVVGADDLARLLGARLVPVPRAVLRGAVAAAFHARLVPAEPGLVELFLSLPLMDATRARRELGWNPRHSSIEALESLLEGWRDPRGADTPPLAPRAGGPGRLGEVASGLGGRG